MCGAGPRGTPGIRLERRSQPVQPPGVPIAAEELLAAQAGVLFNLFMVAVLVGTSLLYRNRPAVHQRLMLLAVLGVLTPAPVSHVLGYRLAPQPWLPLMLPLIAVASCP